MYVFFRRQNVGTLTPDGTFPLDCGSQQTFTCNVTGQAALWTIKRLNGIIVTRDSGQIAANISARINTTDTSGLTQSSTITITGFTTADNGGTIQCNNLEDGSVQGMAGISVGEWLFDRIQRYYYYLEGIYTAYCNIVLCAINVY